jgi:hypothetical protein
LPIAVADVGRIIESSEVLPNFVDKLKNVDCGSSLAG